jgi:hypothetical protein
MISIDSLTVPTDIYHDPPLQKIHNHRTWTNAWSTAALSPVWACGGAGGVGRGTMRTSSCHRECAPFYPLSLSRRIRLDWIGLDWIGFTVPIRYPVGFAHVISHQPMQARLPTTQITTLNTHTYTHV